MLLSRILSSLLLGAILFGAVWSGEPWFSIVVAIAALLGVTEFYAISGQGRLHPLTVFGTLWTLFFIFNAYYGYDSETTRLIATLGLMASAVLVSLMVFLLSYGRTRSVTASWSWSLAGVFYIGFLLSFWVLLMNSPNWEGRDWVLIALIANFATDTCAFFTGRALGRHKLAPSISPAKTWEGAIGGAAGAVAAVIILGTVLNAPAGYLLLAGLGLLIGVAAQVGDLAESKLKRMAGVKESGNMIPGHGGILDRLDSIVITGVVVYYFLGWALG
ncbi:MAG: phosphatidate cytidylyltransferase [Dehalococcoidia bacterium]|nr:phosphatidate cytidylyltransferase [Dehalococcoidia bacterium]